MYTGTYLPGTGEAIPAGPSPEIREPAPRQRGSAVPLGHGLAGHDLHTLWDRVQFRQNPLEYGRAFMRRMHHPFHEVLAGLYLGADDQAVAYNGYFRGDRTSALAHLPVVVQTARQLGCPRLLLAHNPFLPDPAKAPDYAGIEHWLRAAGIELLDWLLIRGEETISLRSGAKP
jgi:DNA repair protein RadC